MITAPGAMRRMASPLARHRRPNGWRWSPPANDHSHGRRQRPVAAAETAPDSDSCFEDEERLKALQEGLECEGTTR